MRIYPFGYFIMPVKFLKLNFLFDKTKNQYMQI